MKILVFEDSYDIEAMLTSAGADLNEIEIEQRWNSENAIERINDYSPDILMLDHFMPPTKGLDVLRSLNKEVDRGTIVRPTKIVAISSASFANKAMLDEGADIAIAKFDLPNRFPELLEN